MRKAISPCSRQGRSSCISQSAMRVFCRMTPMPGRARSLGCSPRSTRWSRRSLNLAPPSCLRGDKPWHAGRLPLVEDRVRDRLKQLSARLSDADWLDGAFSAGDLMMVSVLLRVKSSGILDEYPNLAAYLARGETRPAYKRAFAAQLAVNTGKPPAG